MELLIDSGVASVVYGAAKTSSHSGVLIGLFLKSLIIGVIGATDCVVVVISNPQQFGRLSFLGIWSFFSAFCHFVLKSTAGVLNYAIVHGTIDILAFGVTAWVTWISLRELEHALDSFERKKLGKFAVKPINAKSIETWLLAGACALDAYPLGHVKGLVMANAGTPKLILGYFISSLVVGCFTFGVALLARQIEMRWRNPVDAFNVLVRALHAWVFLAMLWSFVLTFVLVRLNVPTIAPTNFVALVALLGFLPLSTRYRRIIKVAWRSHVEYRNSKQQD